MEVYMKKAVFTSFDELYADYALVLLKTFCENYHGEPIDFYCLVPKDLHYLQEEYIDKCENPSNVSIKFVTADKQSEIEKRFYSSEIGISYITIQCFHRIFIADAFPELDVAIYIDPDTMILRDVQPLIDYPLPSPIVAKSETMDEIKEKISGHDGIYFNNGVYKTDLNFWRENNISDKMLSHLDSNGLSIYPEQDLMNIFLSKHVSELSINMNFFAWYDSIGFFKYTVPDPMIIHFSGPDKPWKKHNVEHVWSDLWRAKYQQIFGKDITKSQEFLEIYPYDRNQD